MKITRDVIHINPVEYAPEGDDVGYIRITTFNEQTTANLQKAIDDLKKQLGPKLKGYVIDRATIRGCSTRRFRCRCVPRSRRDRAHARA